MASRGHEVGTASGTQFQGTESTDEWGARNTTHRPEVIVTHWTVGDARNTTRRPEGVRCGATSNHVTVVCGTPCRLARGQSSLGTLLDGSVYH